MLACVLAAALAAAPAPPAAPEPDRAARPRTVTGTLSAVSLPDRSLTLAAAEGPLQLSLDRNTLIFLETRMGTVRDLSAGLTARALVGARGEAYWIEILPMGAASPSAPQAPPAPPPAAAPARPASPPEAPASSPAAPAAPPPAAAPAAPPRPPG
jgi:2-oxoglutarate dehydrogenase E2 component (dihydrolipoamide succinyltransferase)